MGRVSTEAPAKQKVVKKRRETQMIGEGRNEAMDGVSVLKRQFCEMTSVPVKSGGGAKLMVNGEVLANNTRKGKLVRVLDVLAEDKGIILSP